MVAVSKVVAILLIAFCGASCASEGGKLSNNPNVGYAEISTDGTLTLNLIGKTEDGAIAHGRKQYKPGDAYYEEIKKHIGDIQPGERKPVPPWE
jgi:hypothetical protein